MQASRCFGIGSERAGAKQWIARGMSALTARKPDILVPQIIRWLKIIKEILGRWGFLHRNQFYQNWRNLQNAVPALPNCMQEKHSHSRGLIGVRGMLQKDNHRITGASGRGDTQEPGMRRTVLPGHRRPQMADDVR